MFELEEKGSNEKTVVGGREGIGIKLVIVYGQAELYILALKPYSKLLVATIVKFKIG